MKKMICILLTIVISMYFLSVGIASCLVSNQVNISDLEEEFQANTKNDLSLAKQLIAKRDSLLKDKGCFYLTTVVGGWMIHPSTRNEPTVDGFTVCLKL